MSRHLATVLRSLVLLAAVAGLFAMHGLAGHGVAHASVAPDHGSHAAHAPEDAPADQGAPVPDEPDHSGAMALCLAVLVGLVALGLALLGRRRTPLRSLLPPAPRILVEPRGRAPDPRDLFRLSVQRC